MTLKVIDLYLKIINPITFLLWDVTRKIYFVGNRPLNVMKHAAMQVYT